MSALSTRLPLREINEVIGPVTTALLAVNLGVANEDQYNHLAGAFVVAQEAAALVQRHNHLVEALEPAVDALNAMFNRAKAEGRDTFTCSQEDVDVLRSGIDIYRAILTTTPRPAMLKAIERARTTINAATTHKEPNESGQETPA